MLAVDEYMTERRRAQLKSKSARVRAGDIKVTRNTFQYDIDVALNILGYVVVREDRSIFGVYDAPIDFGSDAMLIYARDLRESTMSELQRGGKQKASAYTLNERHGCRPTEFVDEIIDQPRHTRTCQRLAKASFFEM